MFTGLIEEIGVMRKAARQGESMVLTIDAKTVLGDVQLGDSIAVNGVCLTVTSYTGSSFEADVTPETFRHTNLHRLSPGSPVNLERAMTMGRRFGGHLVQGHIDGIGQIAARKPEQNAVVFRIDEVDPELLKYIVPRGSVAIDGVSLTVIEADDRGFAVSIIPHTLQQTILRQKHPGDTVNIETDILGKYVERLLTARLADHRPARAGMKPAGTITEAFLAENGFM